MSRRIRTGLTAALVLASVVVGVLVGYNLRGRGDNDLKHITHQDATTWTCSMHPQIQLPEPGQCPICGMDLIPLTNDPDSDAAFAGVRLSPAAQQLAEVATQKVRRVVPQKQIHLVGTLQPDEGKLREITARVAGRIERLHANTTGQSIDRGQPLFDLYSPALVSNQQELHQAKATFESVRSDGSKRNQQSALRTLQASRARLLSWGLTNTQIEHIESLGEVNESLTILSPVTGIVVERHVSDGAYIKEGQRIHTLADLSQLWLQLDAYESDLAAITAGQNVSFTIESFPGQEFSGTVEFVEPVLTLSTRTVRVRVTVPNPDGKLRPGMYARARIQMASGDDARSALVIPATAPLRTGKRAIVYMPVPEMPGAYVSREVTLGPVTDGGIVVVDGLKEGDTIVTSGAFKIDSALQILGKPSMMNPADPPADKREVHSSNPAVEISVAQDIPAGFVGRLNDVYQRYFDTGSALSQDDHPSARNHANAILAALVLPDPHSLSQTRRRGWNERRIEIGSAAKALVGSDDIASARLAFFDLSQALAELVEAFGASGDFPIYRYHCPMARDNAGADWLQSTVGVENPYYGSRMFRCGSRTGVLISGPTHQHDER